MKTSSAVRRRLGQLEAEVLAIVARATEDVSAADIQARLPGHPAYTTVNTVLFRLHDKRRVSRLRQGRHFLYRAAVDEPGLVAEQMYGHLRCAGNPGDALSQFVRALSPAQEQILWLALDGQPPA